MNPPATPVTDQESARRLAFLCGAALFLAAILVNLRVVGFGFLYLRDDDINVALNPHMGGLDLGRLAWMFTDSDYVRRYIPLGWLGFSATFQFSGLDPAGYHGVGVALHALNTLLVFRVLLALGRLFPAGAPRWAVGSAALWAAWWALHPMRVETTAWVSGNLYGQSAALALLAVLAYLRSYDAAGRRRAAWLVASAAAFIASLLTYPVALGLPVLLAGLDWLRSRRHPAPPWRRLLVEKALFVAPLVAVGAVTLSARLSSTQVYGAIPSMRDMPVLTRAAQSAYVACYYLWKPWWPTHLSPLYDTLVSFSPTAPAFLASLAAAAAATGLSVAWFRRRPWLAVAWFGYLALALPYFGLTEWPHMASDRYACLLSIVFAAVGSAGLARLGAALRAAAALALLAVISLLARSTLLQERIWTNDRVQHAYVARHLTNPILADDFRGRQLILDFLRGDEKGVTAAVEDGLKANPSSPGLRKAAAIIAEKRRIGAYYGDTPVLAILHEQNGLAFARVGQFREADEHLRQALEIDDHFYQAAFDRALVLLDQGRCDEALRSYLLSVRWAKADLDPGRRRMFVTRLRECAVLAGRPALAHAASEALAR